MRLTPDMVAEGDQGLNCLGDRELELRNKAIPAIENLALAKDGFDTIDLSANMITILGDGFPPFPRLQTLYVAHNRIERIEQGLAASLPNLTSLVLTSNRIASLQALNLPELSKLKHLELLSILENPVSKNLHVRDELVNALPKLKYLNYSKISVEERRSSTNAGKPVETPTRKNAKATRKRNRRDVAVGGNNAAGNGDAGDSGQTGGDGSSANVVSVEGQPPVKKSKTLTPEESQAVRSFIENAKTINDVTRIQEALRNGTVLQFLASIKSQREPPTAGA